MWEYADLDRTEMTCRLCGAEWTADDYRWIAQRVPTWMLASEQSRAS